MKRLVFAGAFLFTISAVLAKDSSFNYPKPQKSNQVDNYFGTKVADPYRGLENLDSPATKKWIEAENKITYDYLASIPERREDQRASDGALELRKVRCAVSRRWPLFLREEHGPAKSKCDLHGFGVAGRTAGVARS